MTPIRTDTVYVTQTRSEIDSAFRDRLSLIRFVFSATKIDRPILIGTVESTELITILLTLTTFSAFCMAISKRVLSRMCLYWLPRYLLHLRMKDLSKDPDFADKLGF